MRNQSQQAMLDGFFASVCDTSTPVRGVTDRAFATARSHLHMPALVSLNDLVVRRADEAGLIARWQGLRVVAGDASVLMPAVRPCLLNRVAAEPEQRLFALYLPGAELTLHASVHSALVGERSMLVEALDCLGPDDVLVLDRGYPAAWLVALLNARGIHFVMRCDNNSGWGAAKTFLRSGQEDAWVTVNAPSADDVRDWGCPAQAPEVRLVRQTAPNGQLRLLATNLNAERFPAVLFADLYHQRWRIEEAFKTYQGTFEARSRLGVVAAGLDHRRSSQDPGRQHHLADVRCRRPTCQPPCTLAKVQPFLRRHLHAARPAATCPDARQRCCGHHRCRRHARRHLATLRPRAFSAAQSQPRQTTSFLLLQGLRLNFDGLELARA